MFDRQKAHYSVSTVLLALWLFNACMPEMDNHLEDLNGKAVVNGVGVEKGAYLSVGKLNNLQDTFSKGFCTATLIGQRHVLTAAHCVTNKTEQGFTLDENLSFIIEGHREYAIKGEPHVHRDYAPLRSIIEDGYFQMSEHDVAVVELYAAPPVQPSAISLLPPDEHSELVVVGYGLTGINVDDFGIKRIAVVMVDWLEELYLESACSPGSSTPWSGDSGAPCFADISKEQVIVGVHSAGTHLDPDEYINIGTHARVDIEHPWITEVTGGDVSFAGNSVAPPMDNTPPEISVVETKDGTEFSPILVQVEATDENGIHYVQVLDNGSVLEERFLPPFDFELEDVPSGSNTVVVRAFDGAGNSAETSATVTKVVDAVAPTVRILSPQEGLIDENEVMLKVEISDDVGVSTASLFVNGEYRREVDTTGDELLVSDLIEGENTLRVEAVDQIGNQGADSVTVIVDATAFPDTELPEVSFAELSEGADVSRHTTIRVEASDNRGIEKIRLWVNGKFFSDLTSAPWNFEATLPVGEVDLTAEAEDLEGNINSATITVNVVDSNSGSTTDPSTPDDEDQTTTGPSTPDDEDQTSTDPFPSGDEDQTDPSETTNRGNTTVQSSGCAITGNRRLTAPGLEFLALLLLALVRRYDRFNAYRGSRK